MAEDPVFVPCEACGNRGMVAGVRCETCNGQGHIRQTAPVIADAPEEPAVKLERLKLADLQAIAERAGLDTSGTRAALIERIEAAPGPASPEASEAPEEPAAA